MAPAAASKIPQIPGTLVSPDIAQFLNEAVAILCALPRTMYVTTQSLLDSGSFHHECGADIMLGTLRFPGSQPVSFGQDSLTTLEEKE
jgi:hypothetical protein